MKVQAGDCKEIKLEISSLAFNKDKSPVLGMLEMHPDSIIVIDTPSEKTKVSYQRKNNLTEK